MMTHSERNASPLKLSTITHVTLPNLVIIMTDSNSMEGVGRMPTCTAAPPYAGIGSDCDRRLSKPLWMEKSFHHGILGLRGGNSVSDFERFCFELMQDST